MTKELYKYIHKKGFDARLDEFDYLYLNGDLAIVIYDKKCFCLSFEVTCEPTQAADITQHVLMFALKKGVKMVINRPYAYVVEDNTIQQVLFGDEAWKYYMTGEVPIEVEPIQDIQVKLDSILDKINKKGMKSLKRDDRQFLMEFSKSKK